MKKKLTTSKWGKTLKLFILWGVVFLSLYIFDCTISDQYNKRHYSSVKFKEQARRVLGIIAVLKLPLNNVYGARYEDEIQSMLDAVNDSDFNVTLDTFPTHHFQLGSSIYLAYIPKTVEKQLLDHLESIQTNEFNVSYQVRKDKWINMELDLAPYDFYFYILIDSIKAGVILLLVIYMFSTYRLAKPLREIKRAADKLGVDIANKSFSIYGPSAMRNIADVMKQMIQQIRKLTDERVTTLAALSHDIRTPLTTAKLHVQMLEEEPRATKILTSIDKIEYLLNEVLAYARKDVMRKQPEIIDLVSLMNSIFNEMKEVGYPVTFDSAVEKVIISGYEKELNRALVNLINNAINYGSIAYISIRVVSADVLIEIYDEGPGLPEEEFSKVTEAFYRFESSRSNKTGGSGLGLAIAKKIIIANGGNLTLNNHDNPKYGLIATVKFLLNTEE